MIATILLVSLSSMASLASPPVCLRSPVTGPIVADFVEPACSYCAGRRAIDFAVAPGSHVVSPVAGVVTFAGPVAGENFITIGIGSGPSHSRLVTLGGVVLDEGMVPVAGTAVDAGQTIGSSLSTRVRLSLRRVVEGSRAEYIDPEPSIARWRGPVRLVPDPDAAAFPRRRISMRWTCPRPIAVAVHPSVEPARRATPGLTGD